MAADIEYDAENDVAYIRFTPSRPGVVDHSVEYEIRTDCPPLVFDLSSDGRIVGIEIVKSSLILAPGALAENG